MRHQIFGRKLNRDFNQRKNLFRSLIFSLIKNGQIKTSVAKAKAIKPLIERIITKVKKGTLSSRRQVLALLPNKKIVEKLYQEISPLFKNRSSGFTRTIKIGQRAGDNSPLVLLKWTEELPKVLETKEVKLKQ